MRKNCLYVIGLVVSVLCVIQPAMAQYPVIPPSLEAKADAKMEKIKARSDSIWKNEAFPIVNQQAQKGRPYVPFASIPKHLPQADIPAFPGAVGGGAHTAGGRGGDVYEVTSLADSGPGTFREALESGGARTIVFNVAGVIHLKTPIFVRAPYVTIAGQTAPGDGVCIAGESVKIETHDVIIRHMRFRRGATDVTRRDDALGGPGKGNIIIDHVSASWGLDENMSMYRNIFIKDGKEIKLPLANITIMNCISSEALSTYNHALGSTVGGLNSTIIRNLWADNVGRNPSIGMWGDFLFANNVLFNWWNRSVDGGDYRSMYNIINNYYKPGPMTPEDKPISHRIIEVQRGNIDTAIFGRTYAHGNVIEGNEKVTENNWDGGVQIDDMSFDEAKKYFPAFKVNHPFPLYPNLHIMPAKEAFRYVLDHVGARLPKRDPVDQRIIEQVRTGEIHNTKGKVVHTGDKYVDRRLDPESFKKGIIMDISQVGGYPDYEGTPYKDSDHDGMPDAYEKKYQDLGLDPYKFDANGDIDQDGYTNLEMYINGIDPRNHTDWTDPNNNMNTLAEKAEGKGLIGNWIGEKKE